jgi:hypothetical protein
MSDSSASGTPGTHAPTYPARLTRAMARQACSFFNVPPYYSVQQARQLAKAAPAVSIRR